MLNAYTVTVDTWSRYNHSRICVCVCACVRVRGWVSERVRLAAVSAELNYLLQLVEAVQVAMEVVPTVFLCVPSIPVHDKGHMPATWSSSPVVLVVLVVVLAVNRLPIHDQYVHEPREQPTLQQCIHHHHFQ